MSRCLDIAINSVQKTPENPSLLRKILKKWVFKKEEFPERYHFLMHLRTPAEKLFPSASSE
jgi:hypothetical protein